MSINPVLFYTLLGSLILIIGGVTVLIIYVMHLVKSIQELKNHVAQDVDSTDHIRHRLQNRYAKALGRNATAVQEVLTNEFKTHMQTLEHEEEQRMQQIVNGFMESMNKGLLDVQQNHIKTMTNVAKNIENSTLSEIELFKKTLTQETVGTQKQMEQQVKDAYDGVLSEIAKYKEDKLKAIDEQIYQILETVSKEAIGKTLSFSDQQELILNSLKKAKQEGFFG